MYHLDMSTNLDDFPKAAGTLIKYAGCQYAAQHAAQYNSSSITNQKTIKNQHNGVGAYGGSAARVDREVIECWWAEANTQMQSWSEEDKDTMKCFWLAKARAFGDGECIERF